MVEARVRRLPGYTPMPDHDDGMSEAGAFLWRLGDAFELWDEQGDALEEDEMRQECQPGVAPAGPPEVRPFLLPALELPACPVARSSNVMCVGLLASNAQQSC